jgi:toxin ParE1/3/4
VARFEVFATVEAEADLDDIVEYVELHDSTERADHLYEKLKQAFLKLEILPGRGRIVPELREIGVMEYREALCKPYRILYFISGNRVVVHAVFDGRRGIEELLSRRLLR